MLYLMAKETVEITLKLYDTVNRYDIDMDTRPFGKLQIFISVAMVHS